MELGWFLGRSRPAYGYSNCAQSFSARSAAQVAAVPDPMPGLTVGGFGLPDNLMIAGARRRSPRAMVALTDSSAAPHQSAS